MVGWRVMGPFRDNRPVWRGPRRRRRYCRDILVAGTAGRGNLRQRFRRSVSGPDGRFGRALASRIGRNAPERPTPYHHGLAICGCDRANARSHRRRTGKYAMRFTPHQGIYAYERTNRKLLAAARRLRLDREKLDRKRVVKGKRGSVRVDLGCSRIIKKKKD